MYIYMRIHIYIYIYIHITPIIYVPPRRKGTPQKLPTGRSEEKRVGRDTLLGKILSRRAVGNSS